MAELLVDGAVTVAVHLLATELRRVGVGVRVLIIAVIGALDIALDHVQAGLQVAGLQAVSVAIPVKVEGVGRQVLVDLAIAVGVRLAAELLRAGEGVRVGVVAVLAGDGAVPVEVLLP